MKFKLVNGFSKINGTSKQGSLSGTPYSLLVQVFGEPNSDGDGGYKVQKEWMIEFADGVVATIHDWKEDKPVEQVTNWSIGGYQNTKAVARVKECIAEYCASGKAAAHSVAATELHPKPAKKVLNVDMYAFRNELSNAQNRAVDIVEAIQQRDGSVPREKLIEYTTKAAEARILGTIIKTLDACTN